MREFNGVHHLALSVPSLDEARAFYVDLLGFPEVMTHAWDKAPRMDQITGLTDTAGKLMMLDTGNLILEFFEYLRPEPKAVRDGRDVHHYGYTHLCLDVVDVDSLHARLTAAGVHCNSLPQVSANASKFYGQDPFGNVIEFQQIFAGASMPNRVPRTQTA